MRHLTEDDYYKKIKPLQEDISALKKKQSWWNGLSYLPAFSIGYQLDGVFGDSSAEQVTAILAIGLCAVILEIMYKKDLKKIKSIENLQNQLNEREQEVIR